MTDLPAGWEWTTLGEVADTTLGKMLDRGKDEGGPRVPYLRNVNVQWGSILLEDVLEMEMSPAEAEFFSLRNGDLLVCEGGEVGRSAVWEYSGKTVSFQKALHRVRLHGGIDSRYLLYFLMHEAHVGGLLRYTTGSTIKHLPQQQLKKVILPIPPLAEQHRIVAGLEDHLSRVEAGNRGIQYAETKLRSWRNSARQNIVFGGMLPKERLPGGWRIGALSEVLDRIESGKSFACESRPAEEDEWGVVKVSSMTWGQFYENENKAILNDEYINKQYEIRPGDVLVSRANTSDYVGAPVLVGDCRPRLLLSDKSLRLVPREGVNSEWLIAVLSSPFVREQISRNSTGTKEAMKNVSQKTLLRTAVPLPPQDSYEEIAASNRAIDSESQRFQKVLETSQTRAEQLRRRLLREAFAGRLVEQDPNDEPASVLLERIRAERASALKSRRPRKQRATEERPTQEQLPREIDFDRPPPAPVDPGAQGALALDLEPHVPTPDTTRGDV